MPVNRNLLDRVVGSVRTLANDQPYHNVTKGRTGKLNDDGTLNADPTDGLPDGWIWLRQSFNGGVTYSRAAVPAHCAVRNDYANLPCFGGLDYEGWLTAFGARVDEEAINQLGAFTAAMSVPQAPSILQNQVTQAALLDVGLVHPSDDGGFTLVVNGYGGGQWLQTTVDVSALSSPATGTVNLGVVMFDPYDLGAFLVGTASASYADTTYGIGAPYFVDIPLLPGAYPLAGIAVAPSAADISKTTMAAQQAAIVDLRLWLGQFEASNGDSEWIIARAVTIPLGANATVLNGVRVTSSGSLNNLGSLYII